MIRSLVLLFLLAAPGWAGSPDGPQPTRSVVYKTASGT